MRRRIEADIQAGLRGGDALARSLEYLSAYGRQNTVKIMTDGLSPRQSAEAIVRQME